MTDATSIRLGQQLLDRGLISPDQLRVALAEQQSQHLALGRILVTLGFISESTLRESLGHSLGTRTLDLARTVPDPAALAMLPKHMAQRYQIVPVSVDENRNAIVVALADVHDLVALDRLRAHLPGDMGIEPVLAAASEIARSIDSHYGHELSIDGILLELETGESARPGPGEHASSGGPIVRLVDALLADAVKHDASDLHFEPESGFLRIRYRIDGLLRQIRVLHRSYWPAMAVRLKVMAGMNIAELRAPQDGRIGMVISGREVDFRVSTMPTMHGENLVVRILDRHKGVVAIAELGLTPDQAKQLELMISRPEGLILVTGPTGSGKTTTLYSLLSHIDSEHLNIMTLEDPVEYPMRRIRQTPVCETTKLDFATGIRAILRQDPDVILVGEIRDPDTAEMALRAAMTGHQVYATLHTNSALSAIPRLIDLGASPSALAGNIAGIVAQRLLRRICRHCRRHISPNAHEAAAFEQAGMTPPTHVPDAQGCARCAHTGYHGRLAIMETLRIDKALDDMLSHGASQRDLRSQALLNGFVPLAANGLQQVSEGRTTLAELRRAVDMTDYGLG